MVYKEYSYGAFKEQIKRLLRKRLALKDRVRYHSRKIEHHKESIRQLEEKAIPEIEKELNDLLARTSNS